MKSFTAVAVVALALFALASSKNIESKFADKDFLVKQKFFLEIFQHLYQDDVFVTKYDQSYFDYVPWDHLDDYTHVDLVQKFFDLWQHKQLLDDEIFTVFNDRHAEYAGGLTRLFYFAKDWTTFTHTVFWARQHVNKHLFTYSLTIASLYRPDLEGISLPAIYEILPWYFFDADTIEYAEKFKMNGFHKVKKLDNIYNVVVKSNYTNHYGELNYEQGLAYFLEDVGLNAFYYYLNIDYPFWSKGPAERLLNHDRRGEFWLYTHWQLLARYYLERLSNGLGEVSYYNVYEPVDNGYVNGLRYWPGVSFPNRPNHYNFYNQENLFDIVDLEVHSQRIFDFIDKHEIVDFNEAVNTLGNIIQGTADSIDKKWFGSIDKLYREIVNVGQTYGKYNEELPGTFLQYETSIRDPLFFEIYKNIVAFYWRLAGNYPEYTQKDFAFNGVKIDKVNVPEQLTTYFEYFDSDISNAVNVEVPTETVDDPLVKFGRNSHYEGHSYVIKARQYRLNHKPFDFELDITSDKAQKAIVKVFIGPKYDEVGHVISLENNYQNFFELTHFTVDLVAGNNVVKRNSNDFAWYVNDRTTYLELYKKVMDATNTDYQFPLNQEEAHCGVPSRIMIPKGKKGGYTYQFFFMVYPYHEPTVKQFSGYNPIVSCGVGYGSRWIDTLPFGFPFNRPVQHSYYFDVDNFHFEDIKIVHKEDTTNVV